MKRKTGILFKARAAVMLLVMMLTATSARADLVCRWTPANGGEVTANGSQVTVTPAAAYNIGSVTWYSGDPEGSDQVSSITLDNPMGYYKAPNSNGYIVATFIAKTTDVRVSFDLNGYRGDVIADQDLTFGQTVTRPATDPTSDYAEFVGWCVDANGKTPYDFTNPLDYSLPYDMSNAGFKLTLYAKWAAHAYHGACGKVDKSHGLDGWNLTWEVSKSTGSANYDVLTISGNGEMEDYSKISNRPWHIYRSTLKTLVLPEGLTNIGKNTFKEMTELGPAVIIPASVIAIGEKAFDNCDAQTDIIIAEGSQLTTIGKYAFGGKKGNRTSISTLPPSVTSIATRAFNYFKGDHIYISVPVGYILTVNGKAYTGEITDNMVDLIGYLFKDPNVSRKNSEAVTLAVTLSKPYDIIITDGTVEAFYREGIGKITQARERETVVLSWSDETVPEGQYVSGFTITKEKGGTVEAKPNEDNMDYTFVMPADNVTVTAQTAPQEEYTLDLTEDEQVALTETQYMLIYTMLGYANYDETLEGWFIDLNRDGKPDLQMIPPVAEDEETDREDEFVNDYSVKRLAGADEVTKNYHFSFEYPFPYRYNGMLVKLNDSYPEAVQPKIEDLMDEFDNTTTLSEWVADGQTHNVMLDGRTLYKDGLWNTLCLPFAVTDGDTDSEHPASTGGIDGLTFTGTPLQGATVMSLNTSETGGTGFDSETGTLTLNFTNATSIAAGRAYIVKWTKPEGYDGHESDFDITNPVFGGVTVSSTEPSASTSNDGKVTFKGCYSPVSLSAGDKSVLYLGDGNKLYWPSEDMSVNACRGYFTVDLTTASLARKFVLNFDGDGEATGIRRPTPDPCLNGGAWYDMSGRRLSGRPTKKGVYVNNGQKIIIK